MWFCIQVFHRMRPSVDPTGTFWHYSRSTEDAIKYARTFMAESYPDYTFNVNEVQPDVVPVVIRGLKESTTEEIRDELALRGWKVTSKD